MSGGGARGLAHIGVLQELEDIGLKPDYIAGTSMGAIIAGLYSIGYTPDEMLEIISRVDLNTLTSGSVDRRDVSYLQKDFFDRYSFSIPLDKLSIQIPKGLSKSQYAIQFLNKLVEAKKGESRIPFFCIATNLETGEQVVLNDKKNFTKNLYASSAFPSLLEPIEINSKLLVDGGVVNNMPIKEMRDRGMDYVIGVDVQQDLYSKKGIKSMLEVVSQISSFNSEQVMIKQRKLTDLLIKPKVSKFSLIDFDKKDSIVKKGRISVRKHLSQLKKILINSSFKEKNENILSRKDNKNDSIFVVSQTINGIKNYSKSYVLGKEKLKFPSNISMKDIDKAVDRLYATDNFSMITYSLKNTTFGNELSLDFKEKKNVGNVKLGLHYDGVYKTSFLVNATLKNIIYKNSHLSLDLVLGDNIRYYLDYFVDNGAKPGFGFHSSFVKTPFDFTIDDENINFKISSEFNSFKNRIYTNWSLDDKYMAMVGLEGDYIKISSESYKIDGNKFELQNGFFPSVYGILALDNLDNLSFPKTGVKFVNKYNYYFKSFAKLHSNIKHAHSISDKFTFVVESNVGLTFGDSPNGLGFKLGGDVEKKEDLISYLGYDIYALEDKNIFTISPEFRYEIFKNNFVSLGVGLANNSDGLTTLFDEISHKSIFAKYGIKSFLGPIEVKYAYSDLTKESRFYFNLGFWF